jgi:predicted phosphoadenosine phosphosulfate sulfurtransferase
MYRHGVPFRDMRICQPYGDDQRKGLDLWHALEPYTWERVLERVTGVNYGARYARNKMLGYHRGLGLPEGHTWKSYTFFLLSTLPDVMRERYLSNFAVFLEWWQRHNFPEYAALPQDGDPKEYGRHRIPTWRRLALCIVKNDFNGSSLSIGAIKDVQADVYERVAAGESVKVRKSVVPFYRFLREEYARFLADGIAGVQSDLPTQTPQAQAVKDKYCDL